MQQVQSLSKYNTHLLYIFFSISDLFFELFWKLYTCIWSKFNMEKQNFNFSIQMCFQGSLANGIIFVILFQFMRNFFFVSRSIVSQNPVTRTTHLKTGPFRPGCPVRCPHLKLKMTYELVSYII